MCDLCAKEHPTKEDVINRIEKMLPDINAFIIERTKKALASGALDLESYANDFMLPKLILSAIGKEMAWQYRPFSKEAREDRDNLANFL